MKSSKRAVALVGEQVQPRPQWMSRNYVLFPQELRDAIPGSRELVDRAQT